VLAKDGVRKFYIYTGIRFCPRSISGGGSIHSAQSCYDLFFAILHICHGLSASRFFPFSPLLSTSPPGLPFSKSTTGSFFIFFVPNFHPLIHPLGRANPSIQIRSRSQLGNSVINLKLLPSRDSGVVIYIVWGKVSRCSNYDTIGPLNWMEGGAGGLITQYCSDGARTLSRSLVLPPPHSLPRLLSSTSRFAHVVCVRR